jgi:hypothetical protein
MNILIIFNYVGEELQFYFMKNVGQETVSILLRANGIYAGEEMSDEEIEAVGFIHNLVGELDPIDLETFTEKIDRVIETGVI